MTDVPNAPGVAALAEEEQGPQQGIASRIGTLAASTSAAQLIAVAGTAIVTRLYTPEALGTFAFVLGVSLIVATVATLRFELLVPAASSDDESAHLLVLALGMAAVTSVGVGLVVAILLAMNSLSVHPLFALGGQILPLSVASVATYQTLGYEQLRNQRYGRLGTSRISQSATALVIQTLLSGFGAAGLLIADALSRIAASLVIARGSSVLRSRSWRIAAVRAVAVRNSRFARYMTPAALLNAVSLQTPFLMIPLGFDAAAAGLYFVSHRALLAPSAMLGGALGQVLLAEGAAAHRKGDEMRSTVRSIAIVLLGIGIPVFGAVVIAGPTIFAVVFGAEWGAAGVLAQVLAPGVLAWSVASPLSATIVLARREHENVLIAAAELATRIASLGLGILSGSLFMTAMLLSVSALVLNTAAIWRFFRHVGGSFLELGRPTVLITALCVPGFTLLALATHLLPGWSATVVFALVIPATIALEARGIREFRELLRLASRRASPTP